MVAAEHRQTLADFRQSVDQTLERVNQTDEAEVITVNGEVRAVLLSPSVYDELLKEAQLARDVATIRRSIQQIKAGEGQEVNAFSAELKAELLAIKGAQAQGRNR